MTLVAVKLHRMSLTLTGSVTKTSVAAEWMKPLKVASRVMMGV